MKCIRCRTGMRGPNKLVTEDYVPTPHPSFNHMKTAVDDMKMCCSHECLMGPRTMIVAAACRIVQDHKYLFVSARHFDQPMHLMIDNSKVRDEHPGDREYDQGFIDQWGNYWNRTEAWKIAKANNQIRRRCGGDTSNGGTLYSENLY